MCALHGMGCGRGRGRGRVCFVALCVACGVFYTDVFYYLSL